MTYGVRQENRKELRLFFLLAKDNIGFLVRKLREFQV